MRSPSTFDPPVLLTARLRLRPYALRDALPLQTLAGAREVADTTLNIPHPYPDGAAEEWIAGCDERWRSGTRAAFAICDLRDDTLLGGIGLAITPAHAHAELGYWLGLPYWGRGYGTEAAREVIAFGFSALRLHRIAASHLVRNPASGRIMQKLGMQREAHRRHAVRKWGVFEDVEDYAILDSDWALPTGDASGVDVGA